jgi:hypothetical protein
MSEKQETFLQSFIEVWRETDKRELLLLFIIGSEIGWTLAETVSFLHR